MRHRSYPSSSVAVLVATSAVCILATSTALAADPTTSDCLAANESSIKLRADHKLRDARAQLLTCSVPSCPTDIRDACMRRLVSVNASMPTVVFEVRDADENELTAVTVTMDGQPLASRLEGMAISLDPGEHIFTFESAGQATAERRLVIHEGEKDRRELTTLGRAAVPPSMPEAPPPPSRPATSDARPAPSPPRPAGSSHVPAYLALGFGGVGLVVSGVFGGLALSNKSSLDRVCGASKTSCPYSSWPNISNMHTDSIISDVGLGSAVAGVGVGVILLLTGGGKSSAVAPEKEGALHVSPWLGASAGGLRGSF